MVLAGVGPLGMGSPECSLYSRKTQPVGSDEAAGILPLPESCLPSRCGEIILSLEESTFHHNTLTGETECCLDFVRVTGELCRPALALVLGFLQKFR